MQEVFEKIIDKLEELQNYACFPTEWVNEEQSKIHSYYANKLTEILKLTEQYNNGWIPCSESLPEEMELVLIYAESTARGGSIRVVAQLDNGFWFAQTSSETLGLTGIGQYNVIAWQPLPPEYQPNICTAGDCPINDGNWCPAAEGCAGYQPKGE